MKLSDILLNPKKAERHPIEMIFVGFFYASLSLLTSIWIFPEYAPITTIFLSTISSLYLIQGAIIIQEDKETEKNSEKTLIKEHSKTLKIILSLFLGFLIAFIFWHISLSDSASDTIFKIQKKEVENLRLITGNSIGNEKSFLIILNNNLKVFFLSFAFAIFYGAGVIFILAWNASMMGFVIGDLTKNILGFSSFPIILTKYLLHGIPEMISYFTAALAGGIVFITIIRGDFSKNRIKKTSIDTISMIGIALFILVIAALIETFVSPLI